MMVESGQSQNSVLWELKEISSEADRMVEQFPSSVAAEDAWFESFIERFRNIRDCKTEKELKEIIKTPLQEISTLFMQDKANRCDKKNDVNEAQKEKVHDGKRRSSRKNKVDDSNTMHKEDKISSSTLVSISKPEKGDVHSTSQCELNVPHIILNCRDSSKISAPVHIVSKTPISLDHKNTPNRSIKEHTSVPVAFENTKTPVTSRILSGMPKSKVLSNIINMSSGKVDHTPIMNKTLNRTFNLESNKAVLKDTFQVAPEDKFNGGEVNKLRPRSKRRSSPNQENYSSSKKMKLSKDPVVNSSSKNSKRKCYPDRTTVQSDQKVYKMSSKTTPIPSKERQFYDEKKERIKGNRRKCYPDRKTVQSDQKLYKMSSTTTPIPSRERQVYDEKKKERAKENRKKCYPDKKIVASDSKVSKLSAIIVPSQFSSKELPGPSKEKQLLEEIKRKEEKAKENRRKVLEEQKLKMEESKKKREEKVENTMKKRLKLQQEKLDKHDNEMQKAHSSQEVVKKPALKQTRMKELVEQNVIKKKSGVLNNSKQSSATSVSCVPKTPVLQKANKIESYELTPVPDSSTYNFSDNEDERPTGKAIPDWAIGHGFKSILINQFYHPPDVDEIFGVEIDVPDLARMFGVLKQRYNKRTSSAIWHTPPKFTPPRF